MFICNHSLLKALKADQTNLVKFPLSPLPCTLSSPFGSPLLSAAANLHVGVPPHHLPLDPHLRGKLDHGCDGTGKSKKGRRSRTVFTELQLMGLEKRFEKQKYLSTPDRWVATIEQGGGRTLVLWWLALVIPGDFVKMVIFFDWNVSSVTE